MDLSKIGTVLGFSAIRGAQYVVKGTKVTAREVAHGGKTFWAGVNAGADAANRTNVVNSVPAEAKPVDTLKAHLEAQKAAFGYSFPM